MDKLMQAYEKDVRLRQGYMHNYSNYGCNAKCPLFIERPDILMHIRILLLIKYDKSIVSAWLDEYMVSEKKSNVEKYTPLIKRLLRSLRHERAFECREFVFIDIRGKRQSVMIKRYI